MIIILRDNLKYEYLPPELIANPEELKAFLNEVGNMSRFLEMFNKDNGDNSSKLIPSLRDSDDEDRPRRRYTKGFKQLTRELTREQVIIILRAHYSGTQKEKDEIAESIGRDWDSIVKRLGDIKKIYPLNPEDVGIKEWPRKGQKVNPYSYPYSRDENGEEYEDEEEDKETFVPHQSHPTAGSQSPTIPLEKNIYSFSQLGMMGWDKLEPVCNAWGLTELFLKSKARNKKDDLISDLRTLMRIEEDKLEEEKNEEL